MGYPLWIWSPKSGDCVCDARQCGLADVHWRFRGSHPACCLLVACSASSSSLRRSTFLGKHNDLIQDYLASRPGKQCSSTVTSLTHRNPPPPKSDGTRRARKVKFMIRTPGPRRKSWCGDSTGHRAGESEEKTYEAPKAKILMDLSHMLRKSMPGGIAVTTCHRKCLRLRATATWPSQRGLHDAGRVLTLKAEFCLETRPRRSVGIRY